MDDADDVVELVFICREPRVVAVGELLRQQRRLGVEIDRFDLTARGHDIINADGVEIQKICEHRPVLAAKVLALEYQRS